MMWVTLATEDALSEAIGAKLIGEQSGRMQIAQCVRRNGFGYLRSRLPSFCEMARHQPVVLITDLDTRRCPEQLLEDWLGARRRPEGLLLRVAVREVESWFLADHDAVRAILQRPHQPLPEAPDELHDPKRTLIELARRGPRPMREALVPARGAIASQGLGYNDFLVEAVEGRWSPERAAARSDSLRRARERLAELAGGGLAR